MWGITNPTNPMMPATEMHAPVRREVTIKRMRITLFVSKPRCLAFSSPSRNAFSGHHEEVGNDQTA